MNLKDNISRIITIINESKELESSKDKLEQMFSFKDFNESITFVNKVAKIAEKQNHHPDIEVKYDKVKITITDHEKGEVSDKCHKFMDAVNKLNNMDTKKDVSEYSRTLKNARKQGIGLRFSKSAVESNPLRFRPYNK